MELWKLIFTLRVIICALSLSKLLFLHLGLFRPVKYPELFWKIARGLVW